MLELDVGIAPLGDVEVAIPSVNVLDVSVEDGLVTCSVNDPVGPTTVDEFDA